MTAPRTSLVMQGLRPIDFVQLCHTVRGVLSAEDPTWLSVMNLHNSFDEAGVNAARDANLDIVYIENQFEREMKDVLMGAGRLGIVLSKHAGKPWVVLGDDVHFLRSVFDSLGVPIVMGISLATAVIDRHRKLTGCGSHIFAGPLRASEARFH